MERHLQKLNWLTVRQLVPAEIDTIILTVGTVEAHGAACLGTDNFIPESIADGIAKRINALIAPTVNYGVTRSLYRYSGGSTIQSENFELYVRDVLDSFADTGFRNVIVLNGHGGNNSSLKSVALEFHQEMSVNIAVVHWWELCAEVTEKFFGQAGGHGGIDETAMIQAIDTALVDESLHDPDFAYYVRQGADVYPVPGTILLYKKDEGYPIFDLDRAKEYQKRVFDAVGDFVAMVLSRWRKYDL
jgi:creatinine amidohydrolase